MGKTLAEKVWDEHVVRSTPGEPDLLYIDLHLIHEVTTPQAFEGLRAVVAAIMVDAFWALAVVYARSLRQALVVAVAAALAFLGLSPILVMLGAVAAMMLLTAKRESCLFRIQRSQPIKIIIF